METMKEKFNNLILDKLPADLKAEFTLIQQETNDFTDEEVCDIYKRNFSIYYKEAETNHPKSLKTYVALKEEEVIKVEGEKTPEEYEKLSSAEQRAYDIWLRAERRKLKLKAKKV